MNTKKSRRKERKLQQRNAHAEFMILHCKGGPMKDRRDRRKSNPNRQDYWD